MKTPIQKMMEKYKEIEVECECGWRGNHTDLLNPIEYGDDIFIDGQCCPECWSEKIGDIVDN